MPSPYDDELHLLCLFPHDAALKGLKIRHDARPDMVAAAERLHAKGLTTLPDGGYLTSVGREAAEHAHRLNDLLHVPMAMTGT
ncbi:TIGR02647 family protein [Cobetia amphilecti]|uniref:TIGR02647 family protein n=1 Tax=Cobetia amphilecti TaxID=1055104 RepID=A0AAP4TVN9_9GAMM|nr:TIGR02647 family protein [Cobetia amphilecti]MDO6671192.1 TIGR02647 family protein [Cobetia amphilecti]